MAKKHFVNFEGHAFKHYGHRSPFWQRQLEVKVGLFLFVIISGIAIARICCEEGKSCKFGHDALAANFRAGCSSCSVTNSFVTSVRTVVLIKRAVSCWHRHQPSLQTAQYLDSSLSDLLQSELQMKLLEVEGARTPVPHSWRSHCSSLLQSCSVILTWYIAFTILCHLFNYWLFCCHSVLLSSRLSSTVILYRGVLLLILGCIKLLSNAWITSCSKALNALLHEALVGSFDP